MAAESDRWERAMERQLARFRAARAAGMPRAGWKVGINVPEVQARLGLAHPLLGWLDGSRVHASGARLETPPGTRWHLEAELAIRIADAVDPAADPDAVRDRVAGVAPALEIVDYSLPASGLGDLVEHCMFHAGCVVGDSCPAEAAADLGTRWPELRVGGEPGPAPRADLVPAAIGDLVRFAAGLLARFDERLLPGDVLLSGSYAARAVALPPHSEACADFGPLGFVRIEIA